VPDNLTEELAQAYQIVNEANFSEEELDLQHRKKDWIYMQKSSLSLAKKQGIEQGFEQGIEQGELNKERSLLLRLIKLRFGETFCLKLQPIILSITSIEYLDQIADWIISCQDSTDFQQKIEQLIQS
jgi:hypothetical protein